MFSLQRLWAIAWKELMVLFFNKVSRILIIVPPLAQIVIFGWAATMEVRNVSFAVLDRDRGLGAERVVGAVLGSPTFVRMVQVADEAEMRKVMDKGDVLFTLVFDSNFSRDLEAGRNATMQILLDGRRSNAAQIACHYVTNITSSLLSSGAAPGVVVRNWFNPNLEFQWFFLPNLIGILTFMLGLVVTGLTVAREREVGTFDQLLVTPSTPTLRSLCQAASLASYTEPSSFSSRSSASASPSQAPSSCSMSRFWSLLSPLVALASWSPHCARHSSRPF